MELWNLWDVSYGARLALAVMRDFPEGIRSDILDSTLPPQINVVVEALAKAEGHSPPCSLAVPPILPATPPTRSCAACSIRWLPS